MLLANISSSEKVESFLVQVSEKEAIIQEAIEELTKNETIKDNPGYTEASDKLDSLVEEIQKEKEDAEGKKEELLEEEKRKQEEAEEEQRKQAEAEEAKRKEEEDWDIREWLLWREGLIGSYPPGGGYTEDHTQYVLTENTAYNDTLVYKFEIDGDEWTLSSFEYYDGKSGELWPNGKPEVPVGTVFHIEITDELREEYNAEKEIVSKEVEELNTLLAKEDAELLQSAEYAMFYYMGKKDEYYYAIVGYKVFHLYDSYFFLTMKTDPSKDSIEVTDAWYKGQSIDKPTLDLDQYKRVY